MEELNLIENRTFRYPIVYRLVALFSVLLFGFIILGSVLAEVEAINNSIADAALHVVGFVSGIAVIVWGLDFATRTITITPAGLQVRWLLRRSVVRWPDVLGWRYRALSLIHIRVRQGVGIFVWPLLENYTDLLNEIDTHQRDRLRDEVLNK
ncbi:MAG TPA: hypothetical protein VMP08_08845 [Anaerolineae bacterium]|nr:hypothetical protein [Anaerolineae bacterium]